MKKSGIANDSNICPKFHAKYGAPLQAEKVDEAVISKYFTLVPELLIKLWEEDGFAGYGEGLFWTINPDKLSEYLNRWEFAIKSKYNYSGYIPFMYSAFGDIYFLARVQGVIDQYWVNMFNINDHSLADQLLVNNLEDFFESKLIGEIDKIPHFEIFKEIQADQFSKIEKLSKEDCYGFIESLNDVGEASLDNIEIVNLQHYLETQSKPAIRVKQIIEKRKEETKHFKFSKIADENLKLAIIDNLQCEKILPSYATEDICQELGIEIDLFEEGYDPIFVVKEFLISMAVADQDLVKLKTLDWQGGNSLAHVIWPYWDGEDDYFSIKDLQGIAVLKNLTAITGNLFSVRKANPLATLKNLEEIEIESVQSFESLQPFTKIKNLKRLIVPVEPAKQNEKIAKQLTEQLDEIKIDWQQGEPEFNYELAAESYYNKVFYNVSNLSAVERLKLINNAIELNPRKAAYYRERSAIYKEMNELEKALVDANKAVELHPKDLYNYSQRARINKEMHNYNEAIADYTTAIELEDVKSNSSGNGLSRGEIYRILKEYEKALPDYEYYLEIQSFYVIGFKKAYLEYLELCICSHNFDKALKMLENKPLPYKEDDERFFCTLPMYALLKYIIFTQKGGTTPNCFADFKRLVVKEFKTDWDFAQLDAWLQNSNIDKINREKIENMMSQLKVKL